MPLKRRLKSVKNAWMKSHPRMPALFIGHGSPMNALADNSFTQALKRMGREFPEPRAIVVISAHWMTPGTWVTAMERPKTIHDFYGFPQALFDVQYPAPGSPATAEKVCLQVSVPSVQKDDHQWGLDHGTWSVLRHMYPGAHIPIVQLSLDREATAQEHLRIGEQLKGLREQGVMIVGSGNIVHNLRQIRWEPQAEPYDWALEFDEWAKRRLEARDFKALLEGSASSAAGRLSVPTTEHYDPLFYVLGASDNGDDLKFEYEEIQNGSISMRCVSFR